MEPDTNSKGKPRRPLEAYVIPAHRNRKKDEFRVETDIKKDEDSEDHVCAPLTKLSLDEVTPPEDTIISESQVDGCCIIVYGFPPSISPEAKENMLSRFYSSGGKSRWLTGSAESGQDSVLFGYSSERKATSMLATPHPTLHTCLLRDYQNKDQLDEARQGQTVLISNHFTK
jgi:hypothetical protein